MTKWLGAALVAGCGTWMGLQRTVWYTHRVETLQALVNAIARMEWELKNREPPIPELLACMEQETQGALQSFFAVCRTRLSEPEDHRFDAIWSAAVQQAQFSLNEEETAVFAYLGQVLGRYDQESQRQALSHCKTQLAAYMEEARKERDRLGRLSGVIGASAGLITVILLF